MTYVRAQIVTSVYIHPLETYLTTVLNNVDLASLWKVIITVVDGRSSLQVLLRHLKQNIKIH